eukprot:589954-Pelagomonas_calceolata.AAC.1
MKPASAVPGGGATNACPSEITHHCGLASTLAHYWVLTFSTPGFTHKAVLTFSTSLTLVGPDLSQQMLTCGACQHCARAWRIKCLHANTFAPVGPGSNLASPVGPASTVPGRGGGAPAVGQQLQLQAPVLMQMD